LEAVFQSVLVVPSHTPERQALTYNIPVEAEKKVELILEAADPVPPYVPELWLDPAKCKEEEFCTREVPKFAITPELIVISLLIVKAVPKVLVPEPERVKL